MAYARLFFVGLFCLTTRAFAATIDLHTTVRDFSPSTHPDFEANGGDDRGALLTSVDVDRKPVLATIGPSPAGTITSRARFHEFFHDTPGVNLNIPLTLTLDDSGSPGVFHYDSSNFFPIDGQGFGNEGRSHNYHFCMELHTSFTYQGGEVFDFLGDDDLWVFINNNLAIDLGGVHGPESASVNLNTLGLTIGNTYNFDLFFCERHTVGSNLHISTNIALQRNDRLCAQLYRNSLCSQTLGSPFDVPLNQCYNRGGAWFIDAVPSGGSVHCCRSATQAACQARQAQCINCALGACCVTGTSGVWVKKTTCPE